MESVRGGAAVVAAGPEKSIVWGLKRGEIEIPDDPSGSLESAS